MKWITKMLLVCSLFRNQCHPSCVMETYETLPFSWPAAASKASKWILKCAENKAPKTKLCDSWVASQDLANGRLLLFVRLIISNILLKKYTVSCLVYSTKLRVTELVWIFSTYHRLRNYPFAASVVYPAWESSINKTFFLVFKNPMAVLHGPGKALFIYCQLSNGFLLTRDLSNLQLKVSSVQLKFRT